MKNKIIGLIVLLNALWACNLYIYALRPFDNEVCYRISGVLFILTAIMGCLSILLVSHIKNN